MITVLLGNGDSAEAESPEEAVVAARTIWDDAIRAGTQSQRMTVAFLDENGDALVPIVTSRLSLGAGRIAVERASQPGPNPVL